MTLTVSIENEITNINKNGEEVTKIDLLCYNLLMVQDSWPAQFMASCI